MPICLVSLIDKDRQWFKSCYGLGVRETARDISFCGHAILGADTFVVENALQDERFAENPLVTGEPDIRFYAGAPLEDRNGFRLGTLCLIDKKPRTFSSDDQKTLRDFADLVEREFQY
ncbi:GAF domain-containing protein [Marinobacter sp. NSM]|uniref:GAF domain-containing protein n=1 Tax=Marinobacter sp. NSM TaxID=3458004 RepID=UPI004035C78B